jgi:hypothetical protein
VPTFEGLADFAAEVRHSGSVSDVFVRHDDYFAHELGNAIYSQLIGAGCQAPNQVLAPTCLLDTKMSTLDAIDIGYSLAMSIVCVLDTGSRFLCPSTLCPIAYFVL